jgi:glycerol-3-phosphate acyltransferase PlsX
MSEKVRLALDVMGGDFGPSVVVPGAEIALSRHRDIEFVLVGDEKQIAPLLAANPRVKAHSQIVHTDIAIRMDDKPSKALRYGRRVSSMWKAMDEVKFGRAAAAVSAGNTGALMAMAAFNLKTMDGIERPALAALWPTLRGESIVLDMGASIGADANALVDMAVMGAAMARVVFDLDNPTVGLLNIGVEEVKGLEFIREAGQILRDTPIQGLDYRGFVEGDDIGKGATDVIVTEGFTGNIALKTGEGTAKQICSPATPFPRFARRWIRARATARCSSASTAW